MTTAAVSATAQPSENAPIAGDAGEPSFPELLRSLRERTGLTQSALADLSTISPRAIRDLESGRANARTRTIHLLADALRLQGLMRELFIHAGLNGRRANATDTDVGPAVPRAVNALLGRHAEVHAMVDALESGRRRMISISGLPGVGKTRVAVEIAVRLSSRRGWPVLWIGPESRAADGRGLSFGPLMRSVRSLIESGTPDLSRAWHLVGQHDVLLVLDGVADATVPTGVEELLAYCPGLRVISTSRAPWHVPGVQAAVLSPLATPGPEWDAPASLDALAGVPSVRLFLDRLTEVRPGFVLNSADADAAVAMCRRLDGLPLALEVVAGRCSVLGLRQLVAVPVTALLDLAVPARSGTVRETIGGLIGSSIARLGEEHRAMLATLSGFDHAWTAVTAAEVLRRPLDEVVDVLSVLIGHGLVRASHGEPATDLHIPNLVRAFLVRRLSPDSTART
ncbi:MAG TPA: helix-turn-helix domain-containing protein [Micromonosporaceae bacterium]